MSRCGSITTPSSCSETGCTNHHMRALAALKKGPAKPMAAGAKMADMKPDLPDIEYDAFLLNGRGTRDPWTYQARPAERIRLRIINAAASTYFRLRLDGHPLAI